MDIDLLIKGGKIHKQVQQYTKDGLLRDGVLLWDVTESIEKKIKELTFYNEANPLLGGVAFPTGVSINNCSAHYTPNPGENKTRYNSNDLIKIDFGVHLKGHILDGAFSYTENPALQPLIDCSQEATNTGIKMSGADACLGDIGASIDEIINGYELTIDGKTIPVVSTYDLCGHQIKPYKIHAGKAVPNVKINYTARMKAGEEYAIETFPSTGIGRTREDRLNISHYMIDSPSKVPKGLRPIYNDIQKRFGTLAFCKRWLNYDNTQRRTFNRLVSQGYIKGYPPLYDSPGSYVAQTEKSIYISSDDKVIVLN